VHAHANAVWEMVIFARNISRFIFIGLPVPRMPLELGTRQRKRFLAAAAAVLLRQSGASLGTCPSMQRC
jgi:hypothetical protein